jgi:TonB family protein
VPFDDPQDRVEITLGESVTLDDDPLPEISLGKSTALADDELRPEPVLLGAPLLIEFDEPDRLDPKRVGLTWELPSPPTAAMRLRSSLSAFAIHALPMLLILFWPATATEVPVIPVQLVLEPPPTEPPPPPQPQQQEQQPTPPPAQPQPRHLASDDLGETKPKTPGTGAPQSTPAAGEAQPQPQPSDPQPSQPSEPQTAAVPQPIPPPPKPKPTPPKPVPVIHLAKPSGEPVAHHEETPSAAPRAARYPGPAASRDEYLAYLLALTRQHLDLLPISVVGSRRGETIVTVAVLADGTISDLSIARSSGYPDIDQRIQAMVAAVQKFPPVPQWFQGHSLELQLTLRFPEALERSN